MDDRDQITGWFEKLYVAAERDAGGIPWARLEPHPELVAWLEQQPLSHERSTLVVASGLGDDAEYLARHGHAVTAFDASETALRWCRERFPDTVVDYHVADLFYLPAGWRGAFDLVIEVFTIQSVALEHRNDAIDAIASTVAPGGTLLVVALPRPDEQHPSGPPWPVSRRELDRFAIGDLREVDFSMSGWHYVVEYRRHG